MNTVLRLLHEHRVLVAWCMWLSGALLLVMLVVVPCVIARLPADYFAHDRRRPLPGPHTLWHHLGTAAKNLLGALLVLVGLAMFVGPGQGSLAMLVGLMLMNFPGKYHLERWLAGLPPVWATLGWIRRRTGQPPLQKESRRRENGKRKTEA